MEEDGSESTIMFPDVLLFVKDEGRERLLLEEQNEWELNAKVEISLVRNSLSPPPADRGVEYAN